MSPATAANAIRNRWTPGQLAPMVLLAAILAIGIGIRLHYAAFLDPFEDGYQNWWISGNLVVSGEYWDRHSAMTQGNWLPLYHGFAAVVLEGAGLWNVAALKAANIALSSLTAVAVFFILRKHGPLVAIAGAAFFVFSFVDIIVSGWSTAESLLMLLVVLAYGFLFHLRLAGSIHFAVSAIALTLAVATRYEAWLVVALLVGFAFIPREAGPSRRQMLWVVVAPLLFMVGYFLYALQWGFLPAIVVQQTSTDIRYQISVGTQPSSIQTLVNWWIGYVSFFPVVLVIGGAYLALKVRSEFGAWVAFSLWAFVVAFTLLGFGNPSYRYVMLTVPFLSMAAAVGLKHFVARVAARWPAISRAGPVVPVVAVVVALAVMAPSIAAYWGPGFAARTAMEPLERAGRFVAALPVPPGKILLSESPIAAYFSGYAPDRILGSKWLPDDRSAALAFLKLEVGYVIYMGVPYYKLRTLFPELEQAATTPDFELVYDAGGSASGTHTILVYRVVP